MAQKEPDTQKPHRNDKRVCSTVFFRIMQPELYQLPGRAVAHPEKQADHCRHILGTAPASMHCSSFGKSHSLHSLTKLSSSINSEQFLAALMV